ncbi:PqqD family protein [Arthrobacter sp. RT-1]|nr:PqqD family protein [Arthrobacter sp. RT-1]
MAQVCTEHRGRVALLHLDATQPVILEGPAAVIWDLIDGYRTERDIYAELEASFDDEPGQMRVQTEQFLASLKAQRLIEAVSGASR